MKVIYILDDNYLTITFLISLFIQFNGFLISYKFQFDKITDFSGGLNFFILSFFTLILAVNNKNKNNNNDFNFNLYRNLLVSLSVMIWAIRLAAFLLFRVLKRGKDDRFDEMRSNFIKFGAFWIFQLLWVWIVSLPITVLNSPNISNMNEEIILFGTSTDIIGLIFFLLGMTLETIADTQKYKWKNNSNNLNQLPICQIGIWKWSRHPNYFGEILLWWGIWLMTIASVNNPGVNSSSKRLLQSTVISPIFITVLLLFLSGLPTAEKPVQRNVFIKSYKAKLDKNSNQILSSSNSTNLIQDDNHNSQINLWNQFQIYLNSTSILFPIPTQIYKKIPNFFKRWFLFDWSIYRFNPNSLEAKQIILELSSSHSHS